MIAFWPALNWRITSVSSATCARSSTQKRVQCNKWSDNHDDDSDEDDEEEEDADDGDDEDDDNEDEDDLVTT